VNRQTTESADSGVIKDHHYSSDLLTRLGVPTTNGSKRFTLGDRLRYAVLTMAAGKPFVHEGVRCTLRKHDEWLFMADGENGGSVKVYDFCLNTKYPAYFSFENNFKIEETH
jgi:hypothetical protein